MVIGMRSGAGRRRPCPGCGALVDDLPGIPHEHIGASAGCWAVYTRVLARQYGDLAALAQAHRLTVDTDAVQHPGRPGRRAIQSVIVH